MNGTLILAPHAIAPACCVLLGSAGFFAGHRLANPENAPKYWMEGYSISREHKNQLFL
jgi:hypothetical protein